MTLDQVRAANWSGSIPIVLSLAPTSLSSPTAPGPIHVLVSRHNFLHIGLQEAVLRLHKYAPPTFSFTKRVVEEPDTLGGDGDDSSAEDGDNVDKDEEPSEENSAARKDGAPKTTKSMTATIKQKTIIYPLCWFEDEETQLPLQWQLFAGVLWDSRASQSSAGPNLLPWRIRVHFTNYPSSQLLDLDAATSGVLSTVERTFKNSLKQALVLQHGQNKVALNMTKQTHQRIWDSIVTSKYAVYKPIQEDIQADPKNQLAMIPVRLVVGPSKPIIQKRCDVSTLTLGKLLHLWLPKHFVPKLGQGESDENIVPVVEKTTWRVAGLAPPLSSPLVELWQSLCHPDNFLYISITLIQN